VKYDVFICYRRDGGEYTAKILHDKLTDLGYKVFFDVESLRSGQFNTKLFSVIDECEDFISVLSPKSLDRCANDDDWVRLEIGHALKRGKNVIPVLLRGFQFPQYLPEDINNLRYRSGIEASTEFFDAFAKRLSEFLKSKPHIVNIIHKQSLLKKIVILMIAIFVVFGAVFSINKFYHTTRQTAFPYTKADKIIVNDVIDYISENFKYANVAMSEYDSAIISCYNYLDNPTESNASTTFQFDLKYMKENIMEASENFVTLEDTLSAKLGSTNLPKDKINEVTIYLQQRIVAMLQNIDYMTFLAGDTQMPLSMKAQILNNFQEILDIEKDIIFYDANEIFLEVNDVALDEFRTETLPAIPYIFDGQEWRDDKDEIAAIMEIYNSKYMKVCVELSSVSSPNDPENELQYLTDELAALRVEAKEKFKPLESDEPGMIWGKMLRFNTLKMYDMCIACLEMYNEKDDTEEVDTIIPIAIEYYKQIDITGIDYGCMVGGYEPDKPHHSFYQLGDILIEMNGNKIRTFDDIEAASSDINNSYQVEVLRFNGSGFDTVAVELQKGEAKILYYEMCETIDE